MFSFIWKEEKHRQRERERRQTDICRFNLQIPKTVGAGPDQSQRPGSQSMEEGMQRVGTSHAAPQIHPSFKLLLLVEPEVNPDTLKWVMGVSSSNNCCAQSLLCNFMSEILHMEKSVTLRGRWNNASGYLLHRFRYRCYFTCWQKGEKRSRVLYLLISSFITFQENKTFHCVIFICYIKLKLCFDISFCKVFRPYISICILDSSVVMVWCCNDI